MLGLRYGLEKVGDVDRLFSGSLRNIHFSVIDTWH